MPERKTTTKRGRPALPKTEKILGNGFTRTQWGQITELSRTRRVPSAQLLREAWDNYYIVHKPAQPTSAT